MVADIILILNAPFGDYFPDKYPYAVVFLLKVVASIVLVYYWHKFTTKPLSLTLQNLKQVAQGKLNTQISEEHKKRTDEIGELSRINQQLIGMYKNVISEIDSSSAAINVVDKLLSKNFFFLT